MSFASLTSHLFPPKKHSDHKPVTAILRLPALPAGLPSAPLIAFKAPYAIDKSWRLKRTVGTALDRVVGLLWSVLIKAGAGNVLAGLLEMLVVAVLSVYWLRSGSSGGGSDLGYWLGRAQASP